MTIRCGIVLAALLGAAGARADLKPALAEPNLEKRSKLALDNASAALQKAREAYDKGAAEQTRELIAETGKSVELAMKSLADTGKNPRRSPKWFKKAEQDLRNLSRRIEALRQEMSYTDRPWLDDLKSQVQQSHDELLTGLLEGRRK